MGASADPGSHTIRGGLCCRVKGCRRSAVRQSFCVGHALEELTNMERIPNAKTFLTNPIHRSCLLNWFIGKMVFFNTKCILYNFLPLTFFYFTIIL
jgi:hypothetical protein